VRLHQRHELSHRAADRHCRAVRALAPLLVDLDDQDGGGARAEQPRGAGTVVEGPRGLDVDLEHVDVRAAQLARPQ
jgi:hypothetical protein